MSHLRAMFAVPFADTTWSDHTSNHLLKHLILRQEAAGNAYRNPAPSLRLQDGVFESHFDFLKTPDASVQALRRFVLAELARTVATANGYTAEQIQAVKPISDSWFHVTRRGGFTILHTHPMASWSGVYCVDPGSHDFDRPESGVLRFHNPHHYSGYFMDAGNQQFQAPYHHGTWSIRLQAQQLVFFPSWLQHEVLPYYGQSPRITVAFNFMFRWSDNG